MSRCAGRGSGTQWRRSFLQRARFCGRVGGIGPPAPALLLAALPLLLLVAPTVVSAQGVTVRGTVVDRSQTASVGGATVRLSGLRPYITDLDGRFELFGVRPGSYTLTVQALGYRTRTMELVLRADTAFAVEMDPDPIVLDSLLVRTGTVTIEGWVTDARNPDRYPWAQVSILPGFPPERTIVGHFKIKKVPAGRNVTVLVESVGYLTARIALLTNADTTLSVALEPDPVGMRMIAIQEEKLETRSHSVPYHRRVVDSERLSLFYPGWPVAEIVIKELQIFGRRGVALMTAGTPHPCLFIDEVPQMHFAFLWGLDEGQVERIEIYDRGGMVRVYTKSYLFRTLGREFQGMTYIKGGLGPPICG